MPGEDSYESSAYPYPALKVQSQSESREISVLTLENAFIKAQWAPSLGGRMVSCFDKCAGQERISPMRTIQTARGDGLQGGVTVELNGHPRLNDLGPVDAAQLDAEDAAGFILAETAAGTELSWHQWVRLTDDSPVIEYEIRVFNRSRRASTSLPTLRIPGGLAIDDGWEVSAGVARSRIHPTELGPQATATLFARLHPIDADADSYRSGRRATVTFSRLGWKVYALADEPTPATILISTVPPDSETTGQTFEANVTLSSATALFLSRAELPPWAAEIAIRGANGEWWLSPPAPHRSAPDWSSVREWPNDAEPASYLNDPVLGHVAAIRLADMAFGQQDWVGLDAALDRALGSNAENPLAWWRRAARERIAGGEDAGAALPNAHYLAPLEPLLRAEAFLNQSPEMGPEPSPLVQPLQGRPEHLVEITARWLETGRLDQSTRWIDEALRHVESPMLLYLQAYAYLSAARMEGEIPNLLRRAGKIGYQPPFPFRDIERQALAALRNRFEDDELLAKFQSFMA